MHFSDTQLSRIEDACLNASAPPQQRWLDGWLLRTHPGKARRARCIHALAEGRLPLDDRLTLAAALYREAGLPMVVRITPFTHPTTLDAQLAQRGWLRLDDTQVLVCPRLPAPAATAPTPPRGLHWQALDAPAYARTVGQLRATPPEQQQAHAQRLALSPVPYQGFALLRSDGQALACGQFAREGTQAGLYDVHTHAEARNQGLAYWLCERMLSLAASEGATLAYLQVDAQNHAAQAVYRRLGFLPGYGYHYREPPAGA